MEWNSLPDSRHYPVRCTDSLRSALKTFSKLKGTISALEARRHALYKSTTTTITTTTIVNVNGLCPTEGTTISVCTTTAATTSEITSTSMGTTTVGTSTEGTTLSPGTVSVVTTSESTVASVGTTTIGTTTEATTFEGKHTSRFMNSLLQIT